MSAEQVMEIMKEAMLVAFEIAGPLLIISIAVGLLVAIFQGRGRILIPVIGATGHITLRVVLSYILAPGYGLPAVAAATGTGWAMVVAFWWILWFRSNHVKKPYRAQEA